MSIENIIDHRDYKYNVKIEGFFEPCCHDNSIKNATQFKNTESFSVEYLYNTTIKDAIKYANKRWKNTPVTLYLYNDKKTLKSKHKNIFSGIKKSRTY